MTVCPKYEKLLLLDAAGELDGKLLFSLQSHLKKCSACRREKETLSTIMTRLKSATRSPRLSAAEADTMVANINRELAAKQNARRRLPGWIRSYGKLIPAAAAACILFIALGILWQDNIRHQFEHHAMNQPDLVESISPDEVEIINNFELLREFDSLEKLVRVVDDTNSSTPLIIEPNNSHGSLSNENKMLYS